MAGDQMTTIRCSTWTILALAIHRPVRSFAFLAVTASDCTCASGTLQVSVDGRPTADITCGASGGATIEVGSGPHTVSAQSPTASWPAQSCDAVNGRTTRVELGCPSR
jgi:hypothetical protein